MSSFDSASLYHAILNGGALLRAHVFDSPLPSGEHAYALGLSFRDTGLMVVSHLPHAVALRALDLANEYLRGEVDIAEFGIALGFLLRSKNRAPPDAEKQQELRDVLDEVLQRLDGKVPLSVDSARERLRVWARERSQDNPPGESPQ